MTWMTQSEAREKVCPLARTQGHNPPRATCTAAECPLWRWMPLSMDDNRVRSAIAREEALIKQENPELVKLTGEAKMQKITKLATEKVGFCAERYIIRGDDDLGFCGLGGWPG